MIAVGGEGVEEGRLAEADAKVTGHEPLTPEDQKKLDDIYKQHYPAKPIPAGFHAFDFEDDSDASKPAPRAKPLKLPPSDVLPETPDAEPEPEPKPPTGFADFDRECPDEPPTGLADFDREW